MKVYCLLEKVRSRGGGHMSSATSRLEGGYCSGRSGCHKGECLIVDETLVSHSGRREPCGQDSQRLTRSQIVTRRQPRRLPAQKIDRRGWAGQGEAKFSLGRTNITKREHGNWKRGQQRASSSSFRPGQPLQWVAGCSVIVQHVVADQPQTATDPI